MAETVQVEIPDTPTPGAGGENATEADPRVEVALGDHAEPGEAAPLPDEGLVREAEALGWKPKEAWKGDPKKWKPADAYVDFHKSVMPSVRLENRRLVDENKQLAARLARLEAAENERAERGEALSVETLQYELQQAQEIGDWKKAAEVNDKLIAAKVKQATKPKPQTQTVDPEVNRQATEIWTSFVADNEWAKDPRMQRVITVEAMALQRADPSLVGRELLDETKDRVRRLYPDRFAQPTRRERPPAMTETGGANGASRVTSLGWNNLKPEVRKSLEPMLAEKGMTKEVILKSCAMNPAEYFNL